MRTSRPKLIGCLKFNLKPPSKNKFEQQTLSAYKINPVKFNEQYRENFKAG